MVSSMVIVGGITRLTNSGLSMVEWKLIMGALPPTSDIEWQEAFDKYQAYPEYQQINYDFVLEDFKSIFWWEYSHRVLGRVIGIVFLLPFLYFLFFGYLNKKLITQLVILFVLGGLQGFLGWYMVKSGLINQPDVSHYRLAIHLVAALILLSYIVWLILSLTNTNYSKIKVQLYYVTMWFVYLVTLLQITFGAFVAGLNAGKFHNSFPLMDGEWLPPTLLASFNNYGWIVFVNNVSGVQFIHRWLGIFLLGILIGVYYNFKSSILPIARKRLFVLVALVISQAIIGILTLLMAVPISFALLHQFLGLVIIIFTIINLHTAKNGFPVRA